MNPDTSQSVTLPPTHSSRTAPTYSSSTQPVTNTLSSVSFWPATGGLGSTRTNGNLDEVTTNTNGIKDDEINTNTNDNDEDDVTTEDGHQDNSTSVIVVNAGGPMSGDTLYLYHLNV